MDCRYFNPRAPCGARQYATVIFVRGRLFQPTRPLRGATRAERDGVFGGRDFNPRAPCGARPVSGTFCPAATISTHAPLAGRDHHRLTGSCDMGHFNPRAPCGARPLSVVTLISAVKFQPTRPLRGATGLPVTPSTASTEFQPTRPLRGATFSGLFISSTEEISTHAPLAGRDAEKGGLAGWGHISTHAPLAGRDSKSVQITMHIFAITDKFQMLLHRMPPVRAFCSFLMQENHADFGCEPPK